MSINQPSEGSNKRSLALLFLAVFIDLLGFGIIIPIIPFFLKSLGGTATDLGWLLASYSIAQFLLAPLWGRLSDKVGRRPIILIGLLGSTIAFTLFGFATTMLGLFIARIAAGGFTAATLPTARAYIADSTTDENRTNAFALIGVAFGLGFAFGPAIGGLLSHVSIASLSTNAVIAIFAGVLTFLNFIFAVFMLPESPKRVVAQQRSSEGVPLISSIQYAFSLRNVGVLITAFLGVNLIFSGFEAMFPLFANLIDASIHEAEVGYIFGIIGVVMIIVQGGLIRPLSKRYSDITLMKLGLTALLIGFVALPFVISFWTIVLAAIPVSIGMAIISPSSNAAISSRVPDEHQGEVMGAYSGMNALTRIFGPLIAGFLFDYSIESNFILAFVVVSLSLLLLYSFFESEYADDTAVIYAD